MKISLKFLCAMAVMMFCMPAVISYGQDIKLVTGRIINKTTRKPFDARNIVIYTFNTVGEAEDAYNVLLAEYGARDR